MAIKNSLILIFLALILAIFLSVLSAPFLPDRDASHWDINGNANGFQNKVDYLWTLPLIMLGAAVLLIFLPFIDPLKENFLSVRPLYFTFVAGFMFFMDYIHGLSIAYNLGYHFNLFAWMMPAFAGLMLAVGFLLERVQSNWFVGIRTPWTLSSPTVWNKTHKLGSILFKWSALVILSGWVFPNYAFWLLILPLSGISLYLVGYSYFVYRQEQKYNLTNK